MGYLSAEREQEVIDLANSNPESFYVLDLAKKTGVSETAVRRIVTQFDLPVKKRIAWKSDESTLNKSTNYSLTGASEEEKAIFLTMYEAREKGLDMTLVRQNLRDTYSKTNKELTEIFNRYSRGEKLGKWKPKGSKPQSNVRLLKTTYSKEGGEYTTRNILLPEIPKREEAPYLTDREYEILCQVTAEVEKGSTLQKAYKEVAKIRGLSWRSISNPFPKIRDKVFEAERRKLQGLSPDNGETPEDISGTSTTKVLTEEDQDEVRISIEESKEETSLELKSELVSPVDIIRKMKAELAFYKTEYEKLQKLIMDMPNYKERYEELLNELNTVKKELGL